jgi:hypothetical protein
MQTPPQAAPANFGGEVVHWMKLILWYWQIPAVSLVLAETTASLEHRLEKQTYNYLHQLKSNAQALEQNFYFRNKRIIREVVIWRDSLVDRCVPWIWRGQGRKLISIKYVGKASEIRIGCTLV